MVGRSAAHRSAVLFAALTGALFLPIGSCSSKNGKCVYDTDCSDGRICIGGECAYLPDGGDDDGYQPQDAGYDAGHDAGYDAGHDAGYDAGQDAGIDGGPEDGGDGGQPPWGVEVLRTAIGSGPSEIGVTGGEESNPEGPMSFAVAADDSIHVLDQANSRVQVFRNNTWLKSVPIPWRTFVDIELAADGRMALLDNCARKAVYLLDAGGNTLAQFPLEGVNIAYAADVGGVFFREGGEMPGFWVEVDDRAVRLALTDGSPDPERISVPGLLSADGETLVRASLIGEVTVMLYRSGYNFGSWDEYSVLFDTLVVHLLGVFVDLQGRAFLGAFLEDDEQTKNEFVVLNSDGDELKRLRLFVQQRDEEIFRPVKVTPDGRIFQLALDGQSVVVRRYDP